MDLADWSAEYSTLNAAAHTWSATHCHAPRAVVVKVSAPPEVGQDQVARIAEEQVLWLRCHIDRSHYSGAAPAHIDWQPYLDISVHNVALVQICERVEQLSEVLPRKPLGEALHALQTLVQIPVLADVCE